MQTAPAYSANIGQRAGHGQAVNAADAGQGQAVSAATEIAQECALRNSQRFTPYAVKLSGEGSCTSTAGQSTQSDAWRENVFLCQESIGQGKGVGFFDKSVNLRRIGLQRRK